MTRLKYSSENHLNRGFTLVEIAVVLAIVALLLGGLLPTISSQVEQRRVSDTRKELDEIQQALIGFAVRYGRLPCPAVAGATGVESPSTGNNCTSFSNGSFVGYLPASTLGISPTDSQGYAIDSWGNRIRYAVTAVTATVPGFNGGASFYVFTFQNGMRALGISSLSSNLLVCSTATNITGTTCDTGQSLTTSGVPAVILSTGKNGAAGGAGSDENANLDNNRTFVSHVPAPIGSTNGEFDDLVIWISPNTLVNRMVAAGTLP